VACSQACTSPDPSAGLTRPEEEGECEYASESRAVEELCLTCRKPMIAGGASTERAIRETTCV
jgi:hypothetical protein